MRSAAIIALAVGLWSGAVLAQVVYRWVDENGEVHYNATLPPEYANRPYQVLQNGIVIKRVDDPFAPELTKEELKQQKSQISPEEAEREKRMRADRLLVLKYHSEDEIIEAMEVEVSNLDYDSRLIEQGRTSVLSSVEGQIREAADRQRAGLPVDPEISKKIAVMRVRLQQAAQSEANLAAREAQIRGVFLAELARFRFLRDGGTPGDPLPPDQPEDGGS